MSGHELLLTYNFSRIINLKDLVAIARFVVEAGVVITVF